MNKSSSEKNNVVETDTNLQVVLGRLLQKERPPEAVRRIEQIIQDAHTIEEKIELIEALDNNSSGSYLNKRDFSEPAGVNPAADFDPATVDIPYFDDIRRARLTVKQKPVSVGFWSYLFNEYSKLKQFGVKSHIFQSGFLFIQLRFNPSLQEYLTSRLQHDMALHLLPGLRYALQHVWLFLDKEEYNTLNLLHLFTAELIDTNFARLDFKRQDLIDRLRKLESLYLSIRALPQGMDHIFKALEEAYKHLPVMGEKYPRLEHYVNALFLQDFSLPSFANFILGANMVASRRLVSYGELIKKNVPPLISRSDWECPAEIYQQIRKHIWEQEQELEPLLRYYDEIRRKVNYMPVTEQGGFDSGVLSLFWDKKFGTGDFSRTFNNLSRFSQQACTLFAGPLAQLLCGEVRSQKGRRFRIFSEQLFSADVYRVESARDSLDKLIEVMPTFPRERFIQLKQSKRGSIPNEAAIIQKVSVLLSAGRIISNRLITVMKGRLTSLESADAYPPVDSLMVNRGGFFLPFEQEEISEPAVFAGMKPAEAVHRTISVLLSLAYLLEDYEVTALLKREVKLKDKIVELGRDIHRLANPNRYQQIREKFRLEQFGL